MSHPIAHFTCSVRTQALPEHSDPAAGQHAYAYTVTIRNTGSVTGQLIGRRWLITDGRAATQEVRGLAVVGRQPLLKPGESFEYTSWVRIDTPTGSMRGTFYCMTDSAEPFEAEVPEFPLVAPQALH
jgi:ApaG protein